jgi:hypothetical protein
MDKKKIAQLERAGWKVGSVSELLQLTPEEDALIEMRLALARGLKRRRIDKRWTQSYVAQISQSSQSRIAKIESGDTSGSLDLILRCLVATGVSRREIGELIAERIA